MSNAMFVRPTNLVSHRLARMAFIMACVAALIVASAGPLHRYLGLEIEPSFAIFR
jgi:low affinity Fe/Cu permease